MIADGSLVSSSLLWRDGLASWTGLADLPDFRDCPRPASNLPQGMNMPIPAGELQPAPRQSSATGAMFMVAGCLFVLCVIAAFLLPAFGMARASSRQIKDSTHVREIHQGLVLQGQGGPDSYVIPSQLDRSNATIPAGEPKDLPSHIISTLIYNGFITPEKCISPAEVNDNIRAYKKYEFSEPTQAAAADKKLALWDPAFRAYPIEWTASGPTPQGKGHLSYALMPPVGARRSKWSNTFQATEAVLGNRGPAYDAVGSGAGQSWILHPDNGPTMTGNTEVGRNSNTLRIHGGRTTWEGNVAYNDNHVNFETRADPETLPFTFNALPQGSRTHFDNLFVDEDDATRAKVSTTGVSATNVNNLLRGWNGGEFDPQTGKLVSITSHLWFD